MKRRAILVALMSASVLLAVSPLEGRPALSDSSYDFAVGGGKFAYGGFAFSVHCQAVGPASCTETSPTPPSGHVVKKYPDPSTGKTDTIQGDATCLAVNATNAFITWQVTQSKDSQFPVGSYWTFGVQDNGPPVNGTSPDLIGMDLSATNPNDCLTEGALNIFTQSGVLQGNIVVNEGVPQPAVALTGDWWYTDTAGNLYILDDNGKWVLVQ